MSNVALPALLLFAAAALGLAGLSRRREEDGRIEARFRKALGQNIGTRAGERRERTALVRWLDRRLLGAGLEISAPERVAGGALVASALLGSTVWGLVGMLLFPAGVALLAYGYVEWLSARRRARLLSQLPSFLDQMMRAVSTGSSLQQALADATREAREPIRSLFADADRLVHLGVTLEDALERSTQSLSMRELDMLVLGLRVSMEYGGGVRQTLAGVVTEIRRREEARRELDALTGETRVSAWVLGLLPVVIAAYVSAINPGYLQGMWADASGKSILAVCVALQLTGSFLMWRMVRSIG